MESYCAMSAGKLFDGSWDLFLSSIITSAVPVRKVYSYKKVGG